VTNVDPPALHIERIKVSFGDLSVLTDLSLSVPAHSITAVLGSSGSGKTTLLRVVAGFERCLAGRISLAGQVIESTERHVPPERRRLGYVPQDGALFPHLTVAGNIGYGLSRAARRSGRIDELLELVGLSGLRRRYPHQLSGGQQQRVALARALALSPSVVLLDEPFAALDAALRSSVREDVIAVLRGSGTSVVLVTHDQQEALSLADQVAVLRGGRIAQAGSPRDLYAHPVDPAMAAFLGEANQVQGEMEDGMAVTPLGRLRTPGVTSGAVIVVVRPEDITLTPGHTESGLHGEVVALSFHGHDSMITVAVRLGEDGAHLRVRVQGTTDVRPGDPVTITASGTVPAWPKHDRRPANGEGPLAGRQPGSSAPTGSYPTETALHTI
jgi:iron(III) transport system ATP-binding protein